MAWGLEQGTVSMQALDITGLLANWCSTCVYVCVCKSTWACGFCLSALTIFKWSSA